MRIARIVAHLAHNVRVPLLVFGAACLMAKFYTSDLFVIRRVHCMIDARIHPSLVEAIEAMCIRWQGSGVSGIKTLVSALEERYPFLAHIDAQYNPNRELIVHVESADPFCVVNEHYLLTNTGMFTTRATFDEHFIRPLYQTIAVPWQMLVQGELDPELMQSIACFSDVVFKRYAITWQSASHVQLHDKKEDRIVIVCDAQHIADQAIVEQSERVVRDLKQRGNFTLQHKKRFSIDVRFSDQIIVCADGGGQNHGARIS